MSLRVKITKKTILVVILVLAVLLLFVSYLNWQTSWDVPFLIKSIPREEEKSTKDSYRYGGPEYRHRGIEDPERRKEKEEEARRKRNADLELKRRIHLFYELSKAEFKVSKEALAIDPKFGKQHKQYVKYWNNINREAFRLKYNIDSKRLEQIYNDGIDNMWPTYTK